MSEKKYFFHDDDACIDEIFETKEELEKYVEDYLKDFDVNEIDPSTYQNIFYGEITHRLVFIPQKISNDPETGYLIHGGEAKFLPLEDVEKQLKSNGETIHDYCY